MSIYVNRVLNLKQIKAIGFDMDHTLVEYHANEFEKLVHTKTIEKLISILGYPKKIKGLAFDSSLVIQGLVIDKKNGNTLKLSRFGKVKKAFHGIKELSFSELQHQYRTMVIDLNDPNYQSLDTAFSISHGVLFMQLSDSLPEKGFENLAIDIKHMIDVCHRDGTLKNEVKNNVKKYIKQNSSIVETLEAFKESGKKLLLITNSEYSYSKTLMEYAFNPFLKKHSSWLDLFEVSLTLSKKPKFFTERQAFLKIDTTSGLMENFEEENYRGLFQGGNANDLQKYLDLEGEEILYLGDHIFGDVVSIKKSCNWRTALVCYPIEQEVEGVKKSLSFQKEIDSLMKEKIKLEKKYKKNNTRIDEINQKISDLINSIQKNFNPHWGELMRAGAEESRFADQLEKYSCIYMKSVADLKDYGAKFYFRPFKRYLPHEL
jgi:HAD superfamily 5'-nucleotidase-like hydrolase